MISAYTLRIGRRECHGAAAGADTPRIEAREEALNRITDERSRISRSLDMIRRERLEGRSPQKVPVENKKANPKIGLAVCSIWCARSDSNARPLGS